MIWCPNSGDECAHRVEPSPKSVFLIVPTPRRKTDLIKRIESEIHEVCQERGFSTIVATRRERSGNILCKICGMIQSTGIGVAVFTKTTKSRTIANLFYEAGMAHYLGKEVIFIGFGVKRTSDLYGLEWVEVTTIKQLRRGLNARLKDMPRRAKYFNTLGEQEMDVHNLEKAAEYFMKAILIADYPPAGENLSNILPVIKEERALRTCYDRATSFHRFVSAT